MTENDIWNRLEGALTDWSRQLDETAEALAKNGANRAPHAGTAGPIGAETGSIARPQRADRTLAERIEACTAALEALTREAVGQTAPRQPESRAAYAAKFQPLLNAVRALEAVVIGPDAEPAPPPGEDIGPSAESPDVKVMREERDAARREAASLRAEVERLQQALAGEAGGVRSGDPSPSAAPLRWDSLAATDSSGHRLRFGQVLVEAGVLTQEDVARAVAKQARTPHRRLGAILVDMGLASDDLVAGVLAAQLQLDFVRIEMQQQDKAAASAVPAHIAQRYGVLPLHVSEGNLVVATANPMDLIALEDLELSSGMSVTFAVASKGALQQAVESTYGGQV